MTIAWISALLLRLDAAANAVLAAILLAGSAPLSRAAGVDDGWPLLAIGVVLALNGVLCWQTARSDLLFVVAVAAVAIADPTGAMSWLRWTLVALADVVAAVAAAKLVCARRLPAASAPALQR
jgi:hypothetical protein